MVALQAFRDGRPSGTTLQSPFRLRTVGRQVISTSLHCSPPLSSLGQGGSMRVAEWFALLSDRDLLTDATKSVLLERCSLLDRVTLPSSTRTGLVGFVQKVFPEDDLQPLQNARFPVSSFTLTTKGSANLDDIGFTMPFPEQDNRLGTREVGSPQITQVAPSRVSNAVVEGAVFGPTNEVCEGHSVHTPIYSRVVH